MHIQHALDPTLAGSIQHQWKRGHTNIKPEQMWLRFRRMWAPGFKKLLQKGIRKQWYNMVNMGDRCVQLQLRTRWVDFDKSRLVFRWLAIPWLQREANT